MKNVKCIISRIRLRSKNKRLRRADITLMKYGCRHIWAFGVGRQEEEKKLRIGPKVVITIYHSRESISNHANL